MNVRVVVARPSTLGEGSLWDADSACLYWIDIVEHQVFRYDPATGENVAFDVGDVVGTVVVAQNGKLLVALRHHLAALDPNTRALSRVLPIVPEGTPVRCNDGKCDPRGRLWVGTMVQGGEPATAHLYRVEPDLGFAAVLGGISISNGLVWNRAATRFYYIDTPTQRIDVFEYDAATGALGERRTAAELPSTLGAPDGMAIDVEDQLWVALWGGGRVVRVDPSSGRITAEIPIPARNVTSCAFGGKELDTLFVTTARAGLDSAALSEEPLTGSLFAVEMPVRGLPSARFDRIL